MSETGSRGRSVTHGHDVNMADVAAHAGVSVATVSRALRDVGGVSDSTRARIRDIASQMAYVVSPEASALSRRATRRVAVVVPRLDLWFYATIVEALERELRAAELDVLLYQVDGQIERTKFVEELPARRKVDAVVMVALPLSPTESERIDAMMGAEIVVAGGVLPRYPSIHADDHAIARTAMHHLVAQGHRRIAMIRTDDTSGTVWSSDVERTRGYTDTVRARRLARRLLVTVPYAGDAGARAMRKLLAMDDPPTAVFAYSDEIALGALSVLAERRVRVPEEISLIGVDGHPGAEMFGLDTIDQDVGTQGRLAAQAVAGVLGLRGATAWDAHDVVVPHRLVERGSVARPREGSIKRRRR